MVPNQFGPHISGSPQPVPLDKQNILGTICPGGPNWLGTICPWGPNFWGTFVHGDRIGWGPFVQRDQSIGDQLWGTKCPGTICVWDQMCHSPLTIVVKSPIIDLFLLEGTALCHSVNRHAFLHLRHHWNASLWQHSFQS